MKHYDAIVVGVGHNGLTSAKYLAPGGMRVCGLERRDIIGGTAFTEAFRPGYRDSAAPFAVSLIRPEALEDLERFGYVPLLLQNLLCLDTHGDYLLLNGDDSHDYQQFARLSDVDYDADHAFDATVDQVGRRIPLPIARYRSWWARSTCPRVLHRIFALLDRDPPRCESCAFRWFTRGNRFPVVWYAS